MSSNATRTHQATIDLSYEVYRNRHASELSLDSSCRHSAVKQAANNFLTTTTTSSSAVWNRAVRCTPLIFRNGVRQAKANTNGKLCAALRVAGMAWTYPNLDWINDDDGGRMYVEFRIAPPGGYANSCQMFIGERGILIYDSSLSLVGFIYAERFRIRWYIEPFRSQIGCFAWQADGCQWLISVRTRLNRFNTENTSLWWLMSL